VVIVVVVVLCSFVLGLWEIEKSSFSHDIVETAVMRVSVSKNINFVTIKQDRTMADDQLSFKLFNPFVRLPSIFLGDIWLNKRFATNGM
jgi:hypothetical protein